jgi:hypothetical protein
LKEFGGMLARQDKGGIEERVRFDQGAIEIDAECGERGGTGSLDRQG